MAELEIKEQIRELNSKVDKILFVLIGDEDLAQQGLVKKVDSHDKWIQEKKIHDAKVIAISSGVSGLAIYLLNFWMTMKGNG
jgi:hypothetical protein